MADRNIFAYTAPGTTYPDYISINRRAGEIVVTVRGGNGGDLAEMTLPQDQLDKLIYALRGARINPLRGSGDPGFSVPTDSIEKARMKRTRRPRNSDNGY